jgi:glycosyltransferase involved in cell wall biosynthesis
VGPVVALVAGKDPLAELGGGHSSYVRAHARAALAAGYAPHLFAVGWERDEVETGFGMLHRQRSLLPLPRRPNLGSPQYLIQSPLHVPQLARALESFFAERPGPHLAHGFGVWASAAVAARARLARRGVALRVIASAYSTNAHEAAGRLRGLAGAGRRERLLEAARGLWKRCAVDVHERRAVREADLVLVNYASVERLLRERHGALAPCLRLPYTCESAFQPERAADAAEPEPLRRLAPAGAPLVVALARHDPRKGLDVLLRALAGLRSAGTPLRAALVGGGARLEAHRGLAEELGLADSIAIPGFVPDPEPWLRHADVFALPSLEEGSGSLALLEALRLGVAVVASRCDGIPEDVSHGESALLVEPGSAEALARALARLAADPRERARLAGAGRRAFEARFSARAFAAALAERYAALGVPPAAEAPAA